MAQSIQCSMCTKRAGTCLCAGCKAQFCRKHFNDHHEQLLKELDGYVEERNTLQDQINKADPHNAVLLQIDEWKKTMIEKVTQVAEQARNQVTEPSTKRADITTKLKELSDKLSYLKETEDFVEDDLKQLKEMTDKLRQDIEKATELPSLELHIDESEQINWNRLIYVKEKPATTENEQNQQQTTDHLATAMASDNKCQSCGKRAASRCGKCSIVHYCSKKCQRQDWHNHKINCTSTGKMNSADYLVKAAMDNVFPEDKDTLNDFGFSKCHVQDEKTFLLGLYIGLISILEVGSKELHQWQQANELALNIRKTYAAARAHSGYYTWFLNNQHLVDTRTPQADIYQLVRKYLSSEDRDKDISQLEPEAKRISIAMYIVLLVGNIPNIEQELWIQFGFCTCNDQKIESELGRVYRALIDQCTLYEFYTNYELKSLDALLRQKKIDGIDSLKARGVVFGYASKSVYHLKQYLLGKNVPLKRSVSVDYGFASCENKNQTEKLTNIYKELFKHTNFDILRLHEACISGTLYKYAAQFVTADANLMRNPYPLPNL